MGQTRLALQLERGKNSFHTALPSRLMGAGQNAVHCIRHQEITTAGTLLVGLAWTTGKHRCTRIWFAVIDHILRACPGPGAKSLHPS